MISVSVFSVFLIALLVYDLFSIRKNKVLLSQLLSITIICTLNIKMGFFLRVGENYISYQSALIYLLAVLCIIIFGSHLVSVGKESLCFLLFVISLVIGLALVKFHPFKQRVLSSDWESNVRGVLSFTSLSISSVQVGYYLMFICIGLILVVSKTILNKDDWFSILKTTEKISKASIIIGYLEFFLRNIFNSTIITDFFIFIFGNQGVQQNSLVLRGGLYGVQGATKESSMFTTTVFYIVLLTIIHILIDKKYKKKGLIWFFLELVLLLINPSLSSVVYIILILLICFSTGLLSGYISSNKTSRRVLFIILILLGVVLVLFNSYGFLKKSNNYIIKRIGTAVEQLVFLIKGSSKLVYSSESIRFSGIIYDLGLFVKRPLFGFGLGSFSCNSGIVSFLSNAGIVAFALWLLFLFVIIGRNNYTSIVFFLEIYILPNLFLNDYETILCLVIPLCGIVYNYSKECFYNSRDTTSNDVECL